MKRFVTAHLVLRILPVLLLFLFVFIECVLYDAEGRTFRICCYLCATAVIYLAYPLTREEVSDNVRFITPVSGYFVAAAFVQTGQDMSACLFLYPCAGLVLVLLAGMMVLKYRDPNGLFRKDAAWCCAEEDSRTVFALIMLIMVFTLSIVQLEDASPEIYMYYAAALLILNIILHARARTGRTQMLSRSKERRIQTILLSGGNMSDVVPEVENAILAKAFRRVEQFMRDHKPYLDDKMTLERMSELLKINKVYVSRAVNKYTNRNFRQYLNWHRVLYSVELMKSDPWLKVIELAFMCGFHSQVTYNMCFKMFMGETPSDMLTRLRLQKPRPEVSRIQVRLPKDEVLPSSQDESD